MSDTKKSSSTTATSKSGKHDENVVAKTAHSIREKVHDLTEEVKEKAHHLKRNNKPKKDKKDTKLATSPEPISLGDSDSDSSSEHETTPMQQPPPSSSLSTIKDASASSKIESPRSSLASKSSASPSTASSTKPVSDEKKEEIAAASPALSIDSANKPLTDLDSGDHVHISFDGVDTVDDLLQRIDSCVEKAEICVSDDKKQVSNRKNSNSSEQMIDDPYNVPIHIKHGDIHTIEDLLDLVNNQPGHRGVILEETPDQSATISIRKASQTSNKSGQQTTTIETKINETSDSKIAESEHDQIHVNIGNLKSIDDLLDRIDDAVKNVPVIIDTKPHVNAAEQGQNEDNKSDVAATSKLSNNPMENNTATF